MVWDTKKTLSYIYVPSLVFTNICIITSFLGLAILNVIHFRTKKLEAFAEQIQFLSDGFTIQSHALFPRPSWSPSP